MRSMRFTPFVWYLASTLATPASAVGQPTTAPKPELTQLQQQFLHTAKRGTNWLARMHAANGRFRYGWIPSLNAPMEGDNYLHQAGAAFALARSARYFNDEQASVRATQAILSLLDETSTDPKNPQVRYTSLPSVVINRLGAAGLVVSAINELPAPKKDLLDKSEEFCHFIRGRAQPDGSLAYGDGLPNGQRGQADGVAILYHPGEALYGLMLSQRHRPAEWKTQLVRKAVDYYHAWWQKNKNPEMIPMQTAAYAEAYRLTKDEAYARCIFEMNDWLCDLQYTRIDPQHPLWRGGFMSWNKGQAVETPPNIGSAAYAESLVAACRVADQAGDDARLQRYRETLEMTLHFLVTLHYTEVNTQHFKEGFRGYLVGGFHASQQDGTLRIDNSQHALLALVMYCEMVGAR